MFVVKFTYATLLAICMCLNGVWAAPVPFRGMKRQLSARGKGSLDRRDGGGSFSAPYWVVYTDAYISSNILPDVSDVQGFNVVILSFLLSTSGASDQAASWAALSASQRSSIKAQYEAAGIKVLVSAFGATDTPTTDGASATSVASTMAAWVKEYGMDGIDVDWEDMAAMNKNDGTGEQWLIDFTNALRAELPQGQYILTHAPAAPWMGTGTQWTSGAYVTVNEKVGSSIDWYNVQFYDQGANEYTTCDSLLTSSSSNNPNSALFQIEAAGFDLNKLVMGKPGTTASATNGYIDPGTLSGCLSTAKSKGWNAGVMVWEYEAGTVGSSWISTVRGSAFSSSSGSSVTTSSSSSSSGPSATTSSSSSGGPSTTISSSTASAASPSSSGGSGSDTSSSDSGSSSNSNTSGSGSSSSSDSDSSSASSCDSAFTSCSSAWVPGTTYTCDTAYDQCISSASRRRRRMIRKRTGSSVLA